MEKIESWNKVYTYSNNICHKVNDTLEIFKDPPHSINTFLMNLWFRYKKHKNNSNDMTVYFEETFFQGTFQNHTENNQLIYWFKIKHFILNQM